MKKIIISAVAKNGVIGKSSGEMPWHSKEEFQHFKNTTLGFPIIMGRVTYNTLGKPLKGRLNIIITGNQNLKYASEDIKIFYSLDSAYKFCETQKFDKIFIIGGAKIYEQAMESADGMIISIMDFEAKGDVYFPKIDETVWEITNRQKGEGFEVLYYMRKNREN